VPTDSRLVQIWIPAGFLAFRLALFIIDEWEGKEP